MPEEQKVVDPVKMAEASRVRIVLQQQQLLLDALRNREGADERERKTRQRDETRNFGRMVQREVVVAMADRHPRLHHHHHLRRQLDEIIGNCPPWIVIGDSVEVGDVVEDYDCAVDDFYSVMNHQQYSDYFEFVLGEVASHRHPNDLSPSSCLLAQMVIQMLPDRHSEKSLISKYR